MKNAAAYGKKLTKLLSDLKKRSTPPAPPAELEPLELMVLAVLREDSSLEEALKALELIRTEFVDYNELRVSPIKDISELLEATISDARPKAERITQMLNLVYDHGNALDLRHTAEMGKRELREHLQGGLGLGSFGEAYAMMYLFATPSLPVSGRLLEKLKLEQKVGPDATPDDTRALLERVVAPEARSQAFELLALYEAEPAQPPRTKAGKPAAKPAAKNEKKKAKKPAASEKPKKSPQPRKDAKPSKKKTRPKSSGGTSSRKKSASGQLKKG